VFRRFGEHPWKASVTLGKELAPRARSFYAARVLRETPKLSGSAEALLATSEWRAARLAPVAGDASARRYYRLQDGARRAILMDASAIPTCVKPYVELALHLRRLGFSAPEVYAADLEKGCAIIEDFGDVTFTQLLEQGQNEEGVYRLATEVLMTLHQLPGAVPAGWREYHPQQMLTDIELYLEWVRPGLSDTAQAQFRECWLEVLPVAHQVPQTLLLRDYHVANLMWLAGRGGVRRAGLIDFQDAYRGPVTYDLMSLLEDARRDVSPALREQMLGRYQEAFSDLDRRVFQDSLAILAAQRHTRVLAIFARLAAREGKPAYQERHSPRVRRMLREALNRPVLARVREWFEEYGGIQD
jgi:aminoglycoside/choline kinase family phosphotransferase